jgi:peroxiredoxin
MKKVLGFIIMAAILDSCNPPAKNSFKINGTVDGNASGWVLLQEKLEGGFNTVDSVQIENGTFSFMGNIDYPEVYFINVPSTKSMVPFFLEASKIGIALNTKDINETKITGSASQQEYDRYLDVIDKFNGQLRENYSFYAKAEEIGDAGKAAHFDSVIVEIDNQKAQFTKDYIKNNKTSPVTPYLLFRNLYSYDMRELNDVMANMDTTLKASAYMPFLDEYLKTLKRTDIGNIFVSFMMPDTAGVNHAIYDMIGKGYLLVDFWASWCRPCREENPNLVAVYNDFKDKGFDILSISLDKEKDAWLKAIHDDNLTWTHLSDLLYWENRAAKVYGVRSIPSNVLLDPNGVIIAKNLRGDDLRKKLEEVFSKPAS